MNEAQQGDETHILEPAKRVAVACDVDVAVAGGGISGPCAAVAAARHGARTLLVDRFGRLGGNMGPGFWYGATPFTEASIGLHDGYVGIPKEFVERVQALGGCDPKNYPNVSNTVSRVAYDMLEQAGVEMMLSAYVADPILAQSRVGGLFVETKSGRIAVRAAVVVDATGDADLARRAGAAVVRHVPPDPEFSPVIRSRYRQEAYASWNESGICFYVAGVDLDRYRAFLGEGQLAIAGEWAACEPNGITNDMLRFHPTLLPLLQAAWESGEYRFARTIADGVGVIWQFAMGAPYGFQPVTEGLVQSRAAVYGMFDTDDWRHVTMLEREQRKMAFDTVAFCRRRVPGFERAYLAFCSPFAGARGGPFIEGMRTVQISDIMEGARFDDVLFRDFFDARRISENRKATPRTQDGYDLPYGMLVPKELDGLLVCGRGAAYVRRGHDPSTRARATTMHLGQAAGTAAAMAALDGKAPRQIDVRGLQRQLLAAGFFLGESDRLRELGLG